MMTSDNETKIWKTAGTFNTYNEANTFRLSLLMSNTHTLVKVKRGGKGGNLYRVKVWNEPTLSEVSPKKKTKIKKGKHNQRHRKHENKKIRD